jgi:hypothetical protein
MQEIVAIVLPVFGILAVGFAAGRVGLLGAQVTDGLTSYVFYVALPLMVFRSVATSPPLGAVPLDFIAAYFVPAALVWTAGALIGGKWFGLAAKPSGICGLSSAYANTMMLGLPLVLLTYGEAGALPLFILVALHLPVMTTACAVHMEIAQGGRRIAGVAQASLRGLVTHPIVLGVLVGVLWRIGGLQLPFIADAIVERIAGTAIPCALFAMGLTLNRHEISGAVRPAAAITALKLLVMPALVWLFAVHLADLPQVWTGVLVIFASAPVGINPFLFATRYEAGPEIVSAAIALSTACSVVTVTVALYLLSGS